MSLDLELLVSSLACIIFMHPSTKYQIPLLHKRKDYQMESFDIIRNPALLTRELEAIHELTGELVYQLDTTYPAKLKPIVQNILASLDRCRAMVKSNGKQHAGEQEIKSPPANTVASSPYFVTNDSLRRRGDEQGCQDMPKKRKNQLKHVQNCMYENFEGLPDDGYSWRKYGQKSILGTKNPRGYYRCRHRDTQGCMAKKKVQRSEENLSIYNIAYQGTHTCVKMPQPIHMTAAVPEKQDPPQESMNSLARQSSSGGQMRLNFSNGLTGAEILNSQDFGTVSPFPSTLVTYEQAQNYHSSTTPEDHHLRGISSPFNSSMTSDVNLLPQPALQICPHRGATPSDPSEFIPAAPSTTSPPCINSDFPWEYANLLHYLDKQLNPRVAPNA